MQWDQNQVLQFIDAYRSHQVLWDPTHDDYYNKTSKSHAWTELSAQMNCPIDELKKKLDSLLGQLRRERMKMKRQRSLAKGEKEYKSRWYAYKHMLFLGDRRKRKKQILSGDFDFEVDITMQELSGDTLDPSTISEVAVKTEFPAPGFCLQLPVEKIVADTELNLERKIEKPLVIVEPPPPPAQTVPPTSDDSQMYANYVASKLRTYSQRMRNKLQHAISNLLYEADNEEFDS